MHVHHNTTVTSAKVVKMSVTVSKTVSGTTPTWTIISSPGFPPYYMMVRVALWDRCTSHDASRSLFARAKPAPDDEAAQPNNDKIPGCKPGCKTFTTTLQNLEKYIILSVYL